MPSPFQRGASVSSLLCQTCSGETPAALHCPLPSSGTHHQTRLRFGSVVADRWEMQLDLAALLFVQRLDMLLPER